MSYPINQMGGGPKGYVVGDMVPVSAIQEDPKEIRGTVYAGSITLPNYNSVTGTTGFKSGGCFLGADSDRDLVWVSEKNNIYLVDAKTANVIRSIAVSMTTPPALSMARNLLLYRDPTADCLVAVKADTFEHIFDYAWTFAHLGLSPSGNYIVLVNESGQVRVLTEAGTMVWQNTTESAYKWSPAINDLGQVIVAGKENCGDHTSDYSLTSLYIRMLDADGTVLFSGIAAKGKISSTGNVVEYGASNNSGAAFLSNDMAVVTCGYHLYNVDSSDHSYCIMHLALKINWISKAIEEIKEYTMVSSLNSIILSSSSPYSRPCILQYADGNIGAAAYFNGRYGVYLLNQGSIIITMANHNAPLSSSLYGSSGCGRNKLYILFSTKKVTTVWGNAGAYKILEVIK